MALVCFFFVVVYMTQLPGLSSFEYVELGFCFYLGDQIYALEWLIFYFYRILSLLLQWVLLPEVFFPVFTFFLQLGTFQEMFLMSDSLFL